MLLPLALLALLALGAPPLAAQVWAGRGRVHGKVTGADGKPVEGATIYLRKGVVDNIDPANPGDGPATVTTDKKGRWSALGLAQGQWTMLIVKEDMVPSQGTIQVSEGGLTQPINITMKGIDKQAIAQAQQEAAQASVTGQAKEALERGNKLLESARTGEGRDDDLRAARAAYMEGLAKLEEVQGDAATQELIATTRLSVWSTVAGIDAQLGQTKEALAGLNKVLEQTPNDPKVLQLVIDLLLREGREEEAKQYIARLPAGAKVDANSYLNLGITAFNKGEMDKAFESFDRTVRENPELADPYYYRGLVWLNRGKSKEARADFEKFLQLAPDHRYAAEAKEFLKSL
jgi:Flp pilus assembly protein TadD